MYTSQRFIAELAIGQGVKGLFGRKQDMSKKVQQKSRNDKKQRTK